MNEILLKFSKYSVVGGSGVFVDFGITYLCKEKLRINKYLSNSIGFIVTASSNYVLNRIWTFESKNENIIFEYWAFIFVSIIGLFLNNFIILIIHEKLKYNFYFAKIGAIGVITLWNFIGNYLYTFSDTLKL